MPTTNPATTTELCAVALRYFENDRAAVVPVPYRTKAPTLPGWERLRLDAGSIPAHFNGHAQNIGLLCGEPSGGLVDVDLDCTEARTAATVYLPTTLRRHGRASSPDSHWWYRVTTALPTKVERYQDITEKQTNTRATLVELRSTGGQTIVPPSVHPGGEPIVWDADGKPAPVDGVELQKAVRQVAAVALLARHWPRTGSRHDCALAVAGTLLRHGFTEKAAETFVGTAARIAGDEETFERLRDVTSTAARLRQGGKATGIPTLKELLDPRVVDKLADWLGLNAPAAGEGKTVRSEAGPDDEEEEESKKPSAAQRLVEIGQTAELFRSDREEAFARFAVQGHQAQGHRETWKVRSRSFRNWLSHQFYAQTGKPPGSQAVDDALHVLEARCQFEGKQHPLTVRATVRESVLYFDLCDEHWRVVRIDRDGWSVLPSTGESNGTQEAVQNTPFPPLFRRYAALAPQVEPVPGGSLEALRPFLNVKDESAWYLVVAWLVAAFFPEIAHPVLVVHGEQGSAKSTHMRLLSLLVDPSLTPLRSEPRNLEAWVQAADHSWLVTLDNVSDLPGWLSDAICRAVTGEGFSKRQLYTDAEDVILSFRRVVAITGIEVVAQRADLLDRAILHALEPIAPNKRRPERDVLAEFEAARPAILGALLSAVSGALRALPNVRLTELPRMADFARVGVAVERALNWPDGSFLSAYTGNVGAQNEEALAASPVGEAVQNFLADQSVWSGSASDLLRALDARREAGKAAPTEWPKNGRALSGQLRRIAPNLRAAGGGLDVCFDKAGARRLITLRKSL